MINLSTLICILFGCLYIVALYIFNGRKTSQPINIDLDSIHRQLEGIPNKVLSSITSSSNFHKGALGELIGYLSLQGQYDRVIPLGNITDFILISFPTETNPGKIVFCDIKTGKARLSRDQTLFKKLIEEKKIEFVKFTINEINVPSIEE